MLKDFPIIYFHTSIEVIKKLAQKTEACFLPVLYNDNTPAGIIWKDTLLEAEECKNAEAFVEDCYTEIDPKKPISELIKLSDESLKKPILVVDEENHLKGIIPFSKWLDISKTLYKFSRQILNAFNKAVIVVDKNGYIAYTSEEWENIHGISKIEGEHVSRRFPESGLIEIVNHGQASLNNQAKISFSSTGATVVPLYKPIKDDSGNITGGIAVVEDEDSINRFKFVAQNMKDIENNLSIIFHSLNEAILITDIRGELLYANNSFYEMFEENKRMNVVKELFYRSQNYLETKEGYQNEDIKLNNVKPSKYLNMSMIPILNFVDEVQGVIYIMRDITEKVKLSEKLNKKEELIKFFNQKVLGGDEKIIAESEKLNNLLKVVLKVADSDASVLITGENGVGKELLAKTIHMSSNRKDRPFITVNCGAIPEGLWESEMFGYEEGAFTGSKKGGKIGKFELANKGTLFLDEVSEMPINTQVKLLRVLQNMEVEKVGSEKKEKVDVRIITATNKDLKEMVRKGEFREDLFYRINVFQLDIPPLRERREDIKPAINYFLELFNSKYKKEVKIKSEAYNILINYDWPGNVREVKNVIEHGVIMADDNYIEPKHLPEKLYNKEEYLESDFLENGQNTLKQAIKKTEKEMIINALKETNYNKTLAMKKLNISRRTFYKKINELSIEKELYEKEEL